MFFRHRDLTKLLRVKSALLKRQAFLLATCSCKQIQSVSMCDRLTGLLQFWEQGMGKESLPVNV